MGSVTGAIDEELDLADEKFAVKSLSHNAARGYFLLPHQNIFFSSLSLNWFD